MGDVTLGESVRSLRSEVCADGLAVIALLMLGPLGVG